MLLRPYQERLVSRAVVALEAHNNTLAVAATGAGKTICLSALGGKMGGKQLIVQHRQELVSQNASKYRMVNPKRRISLYTADSKSWSGDAVFAMAQTLSTENNLKKVPKIDMLVIDEAHHSCAPSWRAIIDTVMDRNPNCKIAGFTATPERADKKGLRSVFSNICDNVTVGELVSLGFLVRPKGFVVDVEGTFEALSKIRGSDFGDQTEVADVLNTVTVNEETVRHWREKADGRRTIVFCSTVQHAQDVAGAFAAHGIPSACVHGAMNDTERQGLIKDLENGRISVLTNVMVLTEGFDSPTVSCVILLRKCSAKSPMVQMIGRGLRTVNPEEHPGIVKRDCVILDFGMSLLTHGDVQVDAVLLEDKVFSESEAIKKTCPESEGGCGAELPAQTRECPFCGFDFSKDKEATTVARVELTELEILEASPFRWCDLFSSGRVMLASGFAAWAGVFSTDGDTYHAIGQIQSEPRKVHHLAATDKTQAMAMADDFLRTHETDKTARKSKSWLNDPATVKQLQLLNRFGYGLNSAFLGNSGMTKYSAACHANFQFNRRSIESALGVKQ